MSISETIRQKRLVLKDSLGIGLTQPAAVHLDTEDIERLAIHQCAIAHCPTSNMKFVSGVALVASLLDRQLAVGLGSDGAASNNRLDLLREMRQASLLAKLQTSDVRLEALNDGVFAQRVFLSLLMR